MTPKMIFLSHELDETTPLYGGVGELSFEPRKSLQRKDSCNTMHWSLGNHTGTHVDAPRHFMSAGRSIDRFMAADWFFDKVQLVCLPRVKPGQVIDAKAVGRVEASVELLLLKTGFERQRKLPVYWKDSPALHPELALTLRQMAPGLRAVGLDVISISNINDRPLGREAHREFLKRDIMLIEDMKLSGIKRAPSHVLVAPLRVKGADGAPCTVFAWR